METSVAGDGEIEMRAIEANTHEMRQTGFTGRKVGGCTLVFNLGS